MANCVISLISVQGLSVLVFLLRTYLCYCDTIATTAATTTTTTTAILTTTTTTTTTILPPSAISNDVIIRESVVIPSMDSEKEAKELYDKALKQYGSYGANARNICAIWELRGCQCSGPVEELALSCRSVGFEEVPLDLPLEIIKL